MAGDLIDMNLTGIQNRNSLKRLLVVLAILADMIEDTVLVVDIGSSSVKAGFSGEDIPAFVFPSTTNKTYSPNQESIEGWVGDTTGTGLALSSITSHPVSRGLVKDWDMMEALWGNLFEMANINSLDNISILTTESIKANHSDRVELAKLLFETFHVPSLCISNSATLSLLASGRTSGLAVECGAGLTTTVPVFEGFALNHAVMSVDYGGQDITAQLKKLFADKGISVDMSTSKFIKEKLSYCSGYKSSDLESTQKDKMTFPLPDGNEVTVDTRTMRDCTDQLFINPKLATGGLINQVHESIILCDDSIKNELTHNIILSGGTSMLPGFGDKLFNDLSTKFQRDSDIRANNLTPYVRVVPNSAYREPGYTHQRKYAPWIGGSLLGSFETYHKCLKITRQEWEENGEVVLNIKNL